MGQALRLPLIHGPTRAFYGSRFFIHWRTYTNGPYVSDFAGTLGPPVGRATRPPAGPTAGNPAYSNPAYSNPAYSNPAYSLETKGRWYYSTTKSLRRAVAEIVFLFVLASPS